MTSNDHKQNGSTRLIIVDISAFIFRAFYAIRMLNAPDGTPVNAVRGVWSMLQKLLAQYQPTHIVIAKDTKGGSFRNEIYDEYKANRSEPPEELIPQFGLISEMIEKMKLPAIVKDGFEADDVIGSLCVQWENDFDEILIASGDKDLMQFVNEKVKMLDTMKDKIYDEKGVFEKMGVKPNQIVDYLTLVGDSSDNIPGVRGIGAKGAAKLLGDFDTLDNAIEKIEEIAQKRVKTALEKEDGMVDLSRSLVKIVTDIELGKGSDEVEYHFHASPELYEFFEKYGFNTAIKQIKTMEEAEYHAGNVAGGPAPAEMKIDLNVIESEKDLDSLGKDLEKTKSIIFDYELTDTNPENISIAKFSVCIEDKYYDVKNDLDLKGFLEKAFQRNDLMIVGHEIKSFLRYLIQNKINSKAKLFDLSQVHYNIDSSYNHSIERISQSYLNIEIAKRRDNKGLLDLEDQEDQKIVSLRLHAMKDLYEVFEKELHDKELDGVYFNMDRPMIKVLAEVEYEGFSVDADFLNNYEKQLTTASTNVAKEIATITGEEDINLRSPKQVGELLFEKMGLPAKKKTKTGYSTDSEVLEDLASKTDSAIPGLILKYREIEKLNSTYVKALPTLINPKTNRIHTHLQQNVAATGRLSSVNPNLQNIPIRSELGREVRKAFVAKDGHQLIGADYSQVELRILAHFSNDETMIKAFNDGVDIHARTASEVMNLEIGSVSPHDRSKAKAVNFGLMYGQSSFGLAKALKISRKEAKDYITMYFQRFARVKSYLDGLKELCEKNGYAETMYGRKRYLPDIHSQNRTVKANAERVAINSPIQGTAADIIKMAMVEIQNRLRQENLQSKMILQIHDELIFECPNNEVEKMQELVRQEMEGIVKLKVPLTVDVGVGTNWYDLK
jgi:DNA polymerase-1